MTAEEAARVGEYGSNYERCKRIIDRAGGWENVSAVDAYEISLHCPDLLSAGFTPQQPEWASVGVPMQEEPQYVSIEPAALHEPLWAGPAVEPITEQPAPPAEESEVNNNLYGIEGPDPSTFVRILEAGAAIASKLVGPQISFPTTPGGIMNPQGGDFPFPEARAISVNVGGDCWADSGNPLIQRRRFLRRRVRFARRPDGSLQMIQSCAPRRMNPLNVKALGRAARRLGRFQAIASHVEKLISKACKTKSRRRAPSMSFGRSCAPRRGC